jgi:hypothetical protein
MLGVGRGSGVSDKGSQQRQPPPKSSEFSSKFKPTCALSIEIAAQFSGVAEGKETRKLMLKHESDSRKNKHLNPGPPILQYRAYPGRTVDGARDLFNRHITTQSREELVRR